MNLSVRAQNLLDCAGIKNPTSESVAEWLRASVPTGHHYLTRMQSFLQRRKDCGEETAKEILAYAFGDEFLKRRRIRLACSVCGETANLQARGETCDKFTRWWVGEHEHGSGLSPAPSGKAT